MIGWHMASEKPLRYLFVSRHKEIKKALEIKGIISNFKGK
jgi:hypothetical protein